MAQARRRKRLAVILISYNVCAPFNVPLCFDRKSVWVFFFWRAEMCRYLPFYSTSLPAHVKEGSQTRLEFDHTLDRN